MNDREALKMALEALEVLGWQPTEEAMDYRDNAITAIEEALAQPEQKRPQNCGTGYCSCIECVMEPEQEPVAMRYDFDGYGYKYIDSGSGSDWKTRIKGAEPLYTTPPQRKPLTDEELSHIYEEYHDCYGQPINANENGWAYERAIEAAHGIKE